MVGHAFVHIEERELHLHGAMSCLRLFFRLGPCSYFAAAFILIDAAGGDQCDYPLLHLYVCLQSLLYLQVGNPQGVAPICVYIGRPSARAALSLSLRVVVEFWKDSETPVRSARGRATHCQRLEDRERLFPVLEEAGKTIQGE